jgi:metal-dependent amidase/aminoacylase/carboxypeptidase family protein
LESHGFQVERQLHGIPTAFCATYKGKAGGPRVAVIAEYDALPGVGHGCGHNLISAAAVGAGVAASKVMEQLDGEVLVVGTPAEEGFHLLVSFAEGVDPFNHFEILLME